MNKINMKYLTPYEEGLNEALENPDFKDVWDVNAAKRAATEAIIEARIKSKMSQDQLAQKSGLKQPNIARIESGSVTPSLQTLGKIAQGLGTRLEIKFV